MRFRRTRFALPAVSITALAVALLAATATASSHMDAPLITLDDAANTTDVYAFVSERDGRKYLSTALAVYPFEEPGIGPNNYRFDDDVRYEIHVAIGKDLQKGRATISYRFTFDTEFRRRDTIRQAFLSEIRDVADPAQNLVQTYTVHKVRRKGKHERRRFLGRGVVPPNNQGLVTPFYNEDDGAGPARQGVATAAELDRYTRQAIEELDYDYLAFAGQRDDGFYADIQAIFDGLAFRSAEGDVFDSQGGFNVHTIALDIPVEELGGDLQQVGVYATTSRRAVRVLTPIGKADYGKFVQVGRQGNPLFCEGLVALEDKDLYNRTDPSFDAKIFAKYALEPELARLANQVIFMDQVAPETNRTDIAAIFIPDVIKVDLSTPRARLAGGSPGNPDDPRFSRMSFVGGDVLPSRIQQGLFQDGNVPGGWPNGRRFGDDVVDIAVTALISDLRADDPADFVIRDATGIDNVDANDIAYNKVFPYAATPLNGRNHPHH